MGILYKKNSLQILTLLVFLLIVINGSASAKSSPSVLYVDTEGNGNYTTIQDAVNNATSGDTIIVYPGTYTENVNVNVSNLSILSYSGNPEDTTVKYLGVLSHNFKISARDVTISGFNIAGSYPTGIYMSGVSGVNINGNRFSGNGCSVQIQGSSRCSLLNNTVTNSADKGFYIQTSSNCTLAGNTVSNTSSYGIYLLSSGNCTLDGNAISNVLGNGVYLYNSGNCNFTGNTVSNITGNTYVSTYDSGRGIHLYNSGSCTLAGNTVSDTDHYGIHLDSSSNCILTANAISDTYYEGICVYQSNGSTLDSNTISNATDGIYLYYSGGCNLAGNRILDTYDDGIYMYESDSCTLSGNEISDSPYGLYITSSDYCTLTGNMVSNANYGLSMYYSTGTVLRNNTASSGKYGFRLYDLENCTLANNNMSGNWYNFRLHSDESDLNHTTGNTIDTSNLVDGKPIYYLEGVQNPSIGTDAGVVYCINCGNAEIKDLVLQNNTYAIYLYNTSSNLQNNNINNTEFGVRIAYSHDVNVSDSRIDNSLYSGIELDEAVNVTINNNTVQNSTQGVYIFSSRNCTLTGNSIRDSGSRYLLYNSANSEINSVNSELIKEEENTPIKENSPGNSKLYGVRGGYGVGIRSEYSWDLRFENNIVDNEDIAGIYLEECQNVGFVKNLVRDTGVVGIYAMESSGVEFLDNTVQNVTGIYLLPSSKNPSFVSSSLVSGGPDFLGYGIYFINLQDLKLKGNTVKDCSSVWGVSLIEPVNATLANNTLQNCLGGLVTISGENVSISGCSANNCISGGILVINNEEGAGDGYTVSGCKVERSYLGLLAAGEGNFTGNTLSGNSYGLVIYDVNNSLICDNIVTGNCLAGIAFDPDLEEIIPHTGLLRSMESPASGNNTIYNNYFNNVNNTLFCSEANNTWNTSKTAGKSIVGGPYLGGNYWANPSGTGFSENCTDADRDGIADSSCEIKNGTFDYLPLTVIPSTKTTHKSSTNYVPSGVSPGVTGMDSVQKRVVAGTRTGFKFNNPVSDILRLSFTSQQYSGNVIVRVEVFGDAGPEEKPEGEVYRLMNIRVGNERFESESNIRGASINFRVMKSWVEENNIDVSTIKINRFHNEKWNPLATELTYEDGEYYYFTAETPGFSRYAITGEKLGTAVITPTQEEENGSVTGEEQTAGIRRRTPGFESIFAVFGVLASVFFAKKRLLK